MNYKELLKQLKKLVLKDFGRRCKDKALGCITCDVYRVIDEFQLLVDMEDWKKWKSVK